MQENRDIHAFFIFFIDNGPISNQMSTVLYMDETNGKYVNL